MYSKTPNEEIDIAVDFSQKLSAGERISSAPTIRVFRAQEIVNVSQAVESGDSVGYFIVSDGKRDEFVFPVTATGTMLFRLEAQPQVATTELMITHVGVGRGKDETKVVMRVSGGVSGRSYTVVVSARTERGLLYEQSETVQVT